MLEKHEKMRTYRFVLLVKVVRVAIEDLDKELDRRSRLHARVGDAKGALETLQHTLAIAI